MNYQLYQTTREFGIQNFDLLVLNDCDYDICEQAPDCQKVFSVPKLGFET